MNNICKLKESGEFESDTLTFEDIQGMILEDKKYGKLVPVNGVITYAIINRTSDMPENLITKAINLSLSAWGFEIPVKFKRISGIDEAMITYQFTNQEDDPNLTKPTLAYAYYPIVSKELRPIIVINDSYPWTIHGNPISMHEIDPDHYPPDTPAKGNTIDLDQVLRHENGHKLGLPHTMTRDNIMFGNYGFMSEHLQEQDIRRMQAKYGKRNILSKMYTALIAWYKVYSDQL